MEIASTEATPTQDFDEYGNPQHGQDYGQQKKDLSAPEPCASLIVILGLAVAVTALTAVIAFYAMQTARREETTTTVTSLKWYFGITSPTTTTPSTPIDITEDISMNASMRINATNDTSIGNSNVARIGYEGSMGDEDEKDGDVTDAGTDANATI